LRDRAGEYFDIQTQRDDLDVVVLDVRKRERHLLLLSREQAEDGGVLVERKSKFL